MVLCCGRTVALNAVVLPVTVLVKVRAAQRNEHKGFFMTGLLLMSSVNDFQNSAGNSVSSAVFGIQADCQLPIPYPESAFKDQGKHGRYVRSRVVREYHQRLRYADFMYGSEI